MDNLIVTTAWGDWHPDVPKGSVCVEAKPHGNRAMSGSYWLVPAPEYRAAWADDRRTEGFRVEPDRHQPLPAFRPYAR